jgi:hypothetical protein
MIAPGLAIIMYGKYRSNAQGYRTSQTGPEDHGSSSLLVNTEGAFYPPRLGSARSGPAGGSSGTCYPAPAAWRLSPLAPLHHRK